MTSFKSGFVGLLGQSNVGKSTFLNAVVGKKLLITSPKPQTTRNRLRCVYTTDAAQIVFVDTPGLHRPYNQLSRHILREAFRALRGLDVLLYMVEPWGRLDPYDRVVLDRLKTRGCPMLLLVNKIDLARGNALEETLLCYAATAIFAELFPISATQGLHLDEVVRTLIDYLPSGQLLFPTDVSLVCSESFLVSEFIREKILELTHQEIPYSTAVRVKWMYERKDGLVEIRAEILVDRESQKGIMIGKGGNMLKQIGTQARMDVEALLGTRVFLELQVKVQKGWTRDLTQIRELTSANGEGYAGE
jgi:GTP-binding protein Era